MSVTTNVEFTENEKTLLNTSTEAIGSNRKRIINPNFQQTLNNVPPETIAKIYKQLDPEGKMNSNELVRFVKGKNIGTTRSQLRREDALREQAGTLGKYILHKIRTKIGYETNNGNNNQTKKRETSQRLRNKAKYEDYMPWVLARLKKSDPKTVNNIEIEKATKIQSLLGNYTLGYIEGAEFPTVLLKPIGNSKLKSSKVGMFCKGLNTKNTRVMGFCDRKELFKALSNKGNQRGPANVYKKGMQGLSIAHIEKLIKKGTPDPVIYGDRVYMAQMLELKRLGDASQVYYAKKINEDGNYCIKPNEPELIKYVKEFIANEGKSSVDLAREILLHFTDENKKFYYNKSIFWSNDRPACLLAYILGVPFVYRPTGSSMYMWLPGDTTNTSRAKEAINRGGILKEIFSGSNSLKKLAILDTFHDFAKSFISSSFVKNPDSSNKAFSLRDILREVVKGNSDLQNFILLFENKTTVKNFENEIGAFLQSLHNVGNVTSNEGTLWETFSKKMPDTENYCVVHDAGVLGLSTKFGIRRAMSPAIIYDPATSPLNTINYVQSNERLINNNKNIMRSNYIKNAEKAYVRTGKRTRR